jgi:hypothetical protein
MAAHRMGNERAWPLRSYALLKKGAPLAQLCALHARMSQHGRRTGSKA